MFTINKIIKKLKEKKGVDNTIEMGAVIIILIVMLIGIIGFSDLLYKNYQVTQFCNETVRIVELTGETGNDSQSYTHIEKLKETMGIKPDIKFDKIGKIDFLETFNVTVELPYKLKIPFIEIRLTISKKATGVSEVYWK